MGPDGLSWLQLLLSDRILGTPSFTSACCLLSALAAVLTIHATVGATSPVALSPDAVAAPTFVFDGERLARDDALLSDEADDPAVAAADV
jgi:hypothetical protein